MLSEDPQYEHSLMIVEVLILVVVEDAQWGVVHTPYVKEIES